MKRGKWRLGILILCLIAAGAALWTLCQRGWTWRVPEALVRRVSIQRLSDNPDALTRDGFVEADAGRSSPILRPSATGIFRSESAYCSEKGL